MRDRVQYNNIPSCIFAYLITEHTYIRRYTDTYIHTYRSPLIKVYIHTIQIVYDNRAEPGSLDLDVRRWCHSRQVIYQPYASGRNLEQLTQRSLMPLLRDRAARKGVSTYAYALKFLLQTGEE